MSHSESDRLALQLLEQLTETVRTLLAMDDDDLAFPTTHGCAMNGGVRRLLIHNAEHDRTHTSAMSAARQSARQMQESELARLTQELIRQRAELVGQLLQMPDELLEAKAPSDDWSIRENVEHILFWENDSMVQASSEVAAEAGELATAD